MGPAGKALFSVWNGCDFIALFFGLSLTKRNTILAHPRDDHMQMRETTPIHIANRFAVDTDLLVNAASDTWRNPPSVHSLQRFRLSSRKRRLKC